MDNLKTETNSCMKQKNQLEPYRTELNKIDGDISTFECKIRDLKCTEESCLQLHCDEYSKHESKDEIVQSVASTELQDDVKLFKSEQTNCGLNIKEEKSEAEDYDYHQGEQSELYTDGTIKTEETVLAWGVSKYECYICDGIFTDKSSLEHHFSESHQNDSKEEHVQHTGFKCEHSGCRKSFESMRKLNSHLKAVHNDKRLVKCQHIGCNKSFLYQSKLTLHMSVHSDERPFKCMHINCNKTFKTKCDLKVHMTVHTDDRPFECEEAACTKSFKGMRELKAHLLLVHSDEKLIKCNHTGCNKSFKSKKCLTRHMTWHSDVKPYKCGETGCNKSFKNKDKLNKHMRVHNDKRPFMCQQIGCLKSFKSQNNLLIHTRIHIDEKPFGCGVTGCSKSFKRKGDLTRHMKVHSAHRPFECGMNHYSRAQIEEKSFEHVKEESTEQSEITSKPDIEIYDEMRNVNERPFCQQESNERNGFQEHDFCYEKDSKLDTNYITVIIKSEYNHQ